MLESNPLKNLSGEPEERWAFTVCAGHWSGTWCHLGIRVNHSAEDSDFQVNRDREIGAAVFARTIFG
jgi:hypothetical protein